MSRPPNTAENKGQLLQPIDSSADCSALIQYQSKTPIWDLKQGYFFKLIALASKWFIMIMRSLFTPVFRLHIWHGLERNSGQNIRVAYIGDGENSNYWQDLVYGKCMDATEGHALYWWQLERTLREAQNNNDIAIVDVQCPFTVLFKGDEALQVPRWVKQRVAIVPSWENVMQGMRRKTRKEAQRIIRKYGFQARITSGDEAATFFYDEIYCPFVLKRYGATAFLVKRQQFLRECRCGQILELIADGKVIAASVIRQNGRQLAIVWTGIMLDSDGTEHPGASDVLDFFSMRYAHQQGCEFLDFGPSRPRLNDGLLNYKKKWGASLYIGRVPQGLFLVIPQNFSDPVLAMLASGEFITLEKGRLVGNIFIPKDLELDDIETRIRQHWTDGLDSLRFYLWCTDSEKLHKNHSRIEFISLENSCSPLKWFRRGGS
jgi:hypothetical protein